MEVQVVGTTIAVRTAVVDLRISTASGVLFFPGIECAVPVAEDGVDVAILGRFPLFGEVEIRFQDWLGRFGLQRRRRFVQGPASGAAPRSEGRPRLTASRPFPSARPKPRPRPPPPPPQARSPTRRGPRRSAPMPARSLADLRRRGPLHGASS